MTRPAHPVLLGTELLPTDPADIVYLTKYVDKLDSGIAFTDHFYLEALSRSPLSTLVMANRVPREIPERLLAYSSSETVYRRQQPLLQLTNGLGSFHHHARRGYLPEHVDSLKFAFIHDEPSAYDLYDTAVWNRENVVDNLMTAQDGYIFVSSNCQAEWNRYPHIAAKPQFYLPNTCAEESFIAARTAARPRAAVRAELEYSPDEIALVVVATVQPRKGQLTAIEALARLRESDPSRRYRLRIIGRATQPAYQRLLEERTAALGLSDLVDFCGQLPKASVLDHIHAADVLVCPSASEAMPLVLLEAMQLRTPIVCTPVGGVPEVLDERAAAFFDAGDADGLARRIGETVDDAHGSLARIDHAEERYWAEFSNERFFARFDDILRELITLADGRLSDATSKRAERVRWALQPPAARPQSVTIEGADASLAALLDAAAPLLRGGYHVTAISAGCRSVELTLGADERALVTASDAALIVNAAGHLTALTEDHAGQASGERSKLNRRIRSLRAAISRRDKLWIGGRLRGMLRRVPGVTAIAARVRAARLPRAAVREEAVASTVFIFNSPTQMVTALALWDRVFADEAATPLVAAVYSTGGSADFSARLVELATRTGRFRHVVDITPTYRRAYAPHLGTAGLVQLQRAFRRALAPYRASTVLIAAFMSARAQKLLYETFADARIRLFEDGLGSYVPKPIKMSDAGLLDRVTSGDCAEVHHIRRIESVDLLMSELPTPPQYAGDLPGVRYPELHVGRFHVDYSQVARIFGARPRRFEADEALIVTQNFFDHLGGRGLTLEQERDLNDAAIAEVLASGLRVVIRPHPRASADVWSPRWHAHTRVEVWRDEPGVPVEALLSPEAPPAVLLGISSTCLFSLAESMPLMPVRRFTDHAFDVLAAYATEEYRHMLEMARHSLAVGASYSSATITRSPTGGLTPFTVAPQSEDR